MNPTKHRSGPLMLGALLAVLPGGCSGCWRSEVPSPALAPLGPGAICLAISPEGKHLASEDSDKVLRVRDLTSGREREGAPKETSALCLAISPDGRLVATGHGESVVKLWDGATGEARGTLPGQPAPVGALAFTTDGKTLAVATWMNQGLRGCVVSFWDVARRVQLAAVNYRGQVSCLAFSPDGKTLAGGTFILPKDPPGVGAVQLWESPTGKEKSTLPGLPEATTAVAFSPDGKTLAFGDADGGIKVVTVTGGQEALLPRGHTTGVLCLAFTPDGKTLASGSEDRTARLWDVSGKKERAVLKGHTQAVRALAYAPAATRWVLPPGGSPIGTRDKLTLATVGADKAVRLWDLASGEELTGPR